MAQEKAQQSHCLLILHECPLTAEWSEKEEALGILNVGIYSDSLNS